MPHEQLERPRCAPARTLEEVRNAVLADLEEVDVVERAADRPGDAEPAVPAPRRGMAPVKARMALHPRQPRLLEPAAAPPARARRRGGRCARARAARGSRSRRTAGSGPRYSMKKSTRSGCARSGTAAAGRGQASGAADTRLHFRRCDLRRAVLSRPARTWPPPRGSASSSSRRRRARTKASPDAATGSEPVIANSALSFAVVRAGGQQATRDVDAEVVEA